MHKVYKDLQYYKFCAYGFLKNLAFHDPFFMLFFIERGLTFFQIGTLYATREIVINIVEIPSGIIADLFGRKRVMMLAFAFYSSSLLLLVFSNSYFGFIIAFTIYGFGDASRTGTHKAMILSYLMVNGWTETKTNYYGHTRSWSQIGSGIGALLSGIIFYFSGDLKLVFVLAIIPYLLDFILLTSYPNYLNGQTQPFSFRKLHLIFSSYFKDLWKGVGSIQMIKILSNTSIYTGFYKGTKDYLQPMLLSLVLVLPILTNNTESERLSIIVALTYFVLFLLTSKASAMSGALSFKIRPLSRLLNVLLVIGVGVGVLSGIAYYLNYKIVAIVLFCGIIVVQNLRRPVAMSFLTDNFNDKIMAGSLSAESLMETFFTAIFVTFLGYVADKFNPGVAISVLGILILFIFYFIRIKNKPIDNVI